jgi:hypothetical protein
LRAELSSWDFLVGFVAVFMVVWEVVERSDAIHIPPGKDPQ